MARTPNETNFEALVEASLQHAGWRAGAVTEWDQTQALLPIDALAYIRETQKTLYEILHKALGQALDAQLIAELVKQRKAKGTLHLLREGFKFHGKRLRLATFRPAHGLNATLKQHYRANRLTVLRQVPCHSQGNSTVDMVLCLNGLPVATLELKNPQTSGTYVQAIRQYDQDRDGREPLFLWQKGALVHFAVDPDEVHMTTRLFNPGQASYWLPFNRGSHPQEVQCGAGNPPDPRGLRTAYFWEEVLQADHWLNLIGQFPFVERKTEVTYDAKGRRKEERKETLIFPRYHQWDAVTQLVETARSEGAGHHYLIQHSAGSGKTNSISWLAHRLASLHTPQDQKVFDCVLVITDRRVLDRQLQDAIYQIDHTQGVVQAIDENSRQLAEALTDGTKIVITTLQKFPFVMRGLLHQAGAERVEAATEQQRQAAEAWGEALKDRKYALIIDEAHSSQSGETARELKELIGAGRKDTLPPLPGEEATEDWEEGLAQVLESRGQQKNLSVFAFTATPKGKTLQIFGRNHEPFHRYSMRQAIEEGFILDVLQRFTHYDTYFKLVKKVDDDPQYPKKKALKALGKHLMLHPENLHQRVAVIAQHFEHVVADKLQGRAKAMLVTQSRLHAVKYWYALKAYLAEQGLHKLKPMVAFSGTVDDADLPEPVTEPMLNRDPRTGSAIGEDALPERFSSPDFNFLIVANKYQTGFDEPQLLAMYVDKRLDNVQAVQTLSRLNRSKKGKPLPMVLDFRNTAEDIYAAFKPYYDTTTLKEPSDPGQLEELKTTLDRSQVYYWSEVEQFARTFFKPSGAHTVGKGKPELDRATDPALDRFKALPEEEATAWRDRLVAFVRLYLFLSQVVPYADEEMEMLWAFANYLKDRLPPRDTEGPVKPEADTDLEYYRLQKVYEGQINLEGDPQGVSGPTAVGTRNQEDEEEPLSAIITRINERFGTDFTDADRLFIEQIVAAAEQSEDLRNLAEANEEEKFVEGSRRDLVDLSVSRLAENDSLVSRLLEDEEFQSELLRMLAIMLYRRFRGGGTKGIE